MKDLQTLAPWRRPMGIELTFVPKTYRPPTKKWLAKHAEDDEAIEIEPGFYKHIKWSGYEDRMRALCEKDGLLKSERLIVDDSGVALHGCISVPVGDVVSVGEDPGCIETPTRILGDWQDAHDVHERVTKAAKHVGLVPYEEHQETGMGHVHTTVTTSEAWNIERDLIERPYLPWFFASPNQNDSCASFGSYSSQTRLTKPEYGFLEGSTYGINRCKTSVTSFRVEHFWDYGRKVRDPYHIEWRAFDAAGDWQEQEAHLAFLQNYYEYCQTNTEHRWPRADISKHAAKIRRKYADDKDACIADFKDLIVNKLKLPWARYEHYIEQNLTPNFEWGERL